MQLRTYIFALLTLFGVMAAKRKPDQFDYKVRESGVDFGCFGFRTPAQEGYHTTFYVMDKLSRRSFQPFGEVEVHYPDEADVEQKTQILHWDDLKFLPHECLTKEILQQWL